MRTFDVFEALIGMAVFLCFLAVKTVKAIRSEDWSDKKKGAPRGRKTPPAAGGPAPRRPAPRTPDSFRSEAADHEHITASGMSKEARLEQLDTLLEAGLLDREEYRERKRRIEEGQG